MKIVSILTHSFVDSYNGQIEKVYGGGLERYLYELCLVLQDMDIQVEIHQLSFQQDFVREINLKEAEQIKVFGYHCDDLAKIPDIFKRMEDHAAGKLIYASCIWHAIEYRPGSIGICHGINWDRTNLVIEQKQTIQENVQRALDQLETIVSVDSHFLTYCRSVCFFQNQEKIKLIPNFVDIEAFAPASVQNKKSDRFRLLFPRRISHERGILVMMAAADLLLKQFPELEITFAGETIEGTDICNAFRFWLSEHPHQNRIEHRVYTFDEMPVALSKCRSCCHSYDFL